ncbi:restriction endonuclease subunit S [Duncaniella muris]|uniref:Restriction endonuclease subunit S n=2 Tax=Bacteroidales TaxID=171549 RepID=A0A2V1IN97_9BACT|nr:restriction endonuclease subunit S [Duncaniella muris]PWB01527.1 restriction endonuclease subunit S [Duncaniella muris]
MDLKKYKLGDVGKIITGKTPPTNNSNNYGGEIPFLTPSDDLSTVYVESTAKMLSNLGVRSVKKCLLPPRSVCVSCIGSDLGRVILTKVETVTNQQFNAIIPHSEFNSEYLYYYLTSLEKYFKELSASSTSVPIINKSQFSQIEISLPKLSEQEVIAQCLSVIDRKIALNREINRNLEAMARQLYDYWFVQFDFPDENGRPYKASGGRMVFNESLGINIPLDWDVKRLDYYIESNNTGDWGYDEPSENRVPVGCVRGADIVKLNDVPLRYVKKSNTHKLLTPYDIVIEVSGGSPVQATGRCAYITPGVIERNYGRMTCSNFCHAFRLKNIEDSAYFYFLWKTLYDNNIMFNFEGKTSGIKNFMTETFLANKWYFAPKDIQKLFFDRVSNIYSIIDSNVSEINLLVKQRDELLLLLMNGQVSVMPTAVNCDLSHD